MANRPRWEDIQRAQLDRGPDFTEEYKRGRVYNTPIDQMTPQLDNAMNEAFGALNEWENVKRSAPKMTPQQIREYTRKYPDTPIDGAATNMLPKSDWQNYLDSWMRLHGDTVMPGNNSPKEIPVMDRRAPEETERQRLFGPGALLDFWSKIKNYRVNN